nr:hypothetical protein [Mycobacterium riyadhense]
MDHATALLELNRLFVAWTETEYHRRTHTETGQPRWTPASTGGVTPAMPSADDLTEAFLWSEYRVVTKTATVSLHANTYQVDSALVGRKWSWCFARSIWKPCNPLPRQELRKSPAAHHFPPRPSQGQTGDPRTRAAAGNGIDYLELTATAHHEQLRHDERIGYHALYGDNDQIPGQLSLDDIDDKGGYQREYQRLQSHWVSPDAVRA